MDEKISLESISRYSDAYAEKVLKTFFSSKDKITGPEILSLSNIQQVNLFVVRDLFKSWKDETQKLKSPYFNYESPDVKEAFQSLMDTLSNNIAINKDNFSPLFKNAVNQTLMAVFDPYDFFSMIISGKNNRLEVASFQEEMKYIKVNKGPLDRLLQKLIEKGVSEISGNEAFAILDQILEEVNFNPEDVDSYLEKFSAIVPLDANKFYVEKSPINEPPPPPPVQKVQPQAAEPAKSNQTAPPKNASINDSLTKPSKATLADNFQRIAKIKDSLTINQKFMFTKVLFHGDFELFSKAIDHLDRQDNMKGAMRYLEQEHASTWDRDSEEFHEFMELVEKRFGN
ncbi:hypothetical protein [Chryseolinea sp. H1M3-3]|uniref:hypothetical protein n=1 Tax=Chryseolinea sp. H1M3-3 TaxID=3034144 RepID=UPI0023EB31A2|nr:hypothetical protein [Chryseolinea sp. H1M3-3]